MQDYLKIANSWPIWVICGLGVVTVAALCVIYMRLVKKNSQFVGISKQEYHHALKTGMVTAIGPSIANVIVVAGMIAVVGAPISWMRLSIIGAASTELTGARVGAEAAGAVLGEAGFTMEALATSWFTMAVNGCGWLLVTVLFTHKMEGLRQKIGGGDLTWLTVMGCAACIGIMGDMCAPYLMGWSPQLVSAVVGALVMLLCIFLSKKAHWIIEYSLGFSIIAGVIAGYIAM